MKQERAIDLDGGQYRTLKHIIETHIPHKEVWAYGSRVKWKASIGADLDLAVFDCDFSTLAAFREALEESNLVISVDVMDWGKIPDDFKENIKRKYVVVQERKIPEGWREVKISELISKEFCTIKNTFREPLSSFKRNTMPGNFPYYGAAGQIDSINAFKVKGFHLLVAEDGTVTSDGARPMLQLVDGKFWVSNHAHILQGKSRKETLLLYYMLMNINIMPYITGAVQPKLSKTNLLKISLLFPPISEQKTITEVLSSLDDKIALLRRQNKTLETTAQTFFHKWFIKDAELDWKKKPLGNIVNIKYGKYLPTKNLTKTGYPVFGANGQIGFYDNYYYKNPQVLISCRGEASGKVNISFPKSFVTSNSFILEIKDDNYLTFEFLKYYALTTDFSKYVSGSAQPQITIEGLTPAPILIPNKNLVEQFTQITSSIEDKILKNQIQIRTLENSQNVLLPKLMSGKIQLNHKL